MGLGAVNGYRVCVTAWNHVLRQCGSVVVWRLPLKSILYGRLSQLVKLLPKILHLDLQPPSELPRCVLMEAAQS